MKFTDLTLEKFTRLLASSSPTPGGGTCSALDALLGASFIAMVARISAQKGDFDDAEDREKNLVRIADEAERLRLLFLRVIDEDSAAYDRFAAAKPGPQAHAALRGCLNPPFELLEGAAAALNLGRELLERYYLPTASDLGLAALNLKTAARGAFLTVNINLRCGKDGAFTPKETLAYRQKSSALLEEAETLAKEIYDSVKNYVES
ncbi:MAG: cyclodeaminase/cyclohydrolase family protein [Spirochaetaceae bacterium]|jgi:formiminotetrahydrofolate cyclodeaminase|nr:cyclodeaminase/cyclohydrolase family protein [Spirochaetaceae bacterium]